MFAFILIYICTILVAVQVTIHMHLIIGLLTAFCGSLLAIMVSGS